MQECQFSDASLINTAPRRALRIKWETALTECTHYFFT
ncbi:hypothetical protein NB696_000514 [Xanthomonas sacchari]|nr:hypothetical protein [Xanthomonas sacchari]MCW0443642.1 hypothetical protein [Xanthomonas sacchari]